MAGTLIRTALGALLALGPGWAAAQLADPTRPPPPAAASAPVAGASAASAAVPREPQLQALRLSSRLGDLALIDDKPVKVGERVGNAQVMAITEDGVLLRAGRGPDRWLRLNPDVRKLQAGAAKESKQ
ncbi:hypothetical protein [Pelomonas sp. SE-A7]|uniref:hypothetical protein n=1 Tax=Pelomonas sp. SE-A7 TaxID=3054953 RepID=UPI00259C983F|nr:hypothetical protein [Pelomonas sp. SE-A7]MDM4767782.1 hypothetical protein [Pelomonas sp. SE-A7]